MSTGLINLILEGFKFGIVEIYFGSKSNKFMNLRIITTLQINHLLTNN